MQSAGIEIGGRGAASSYQPVLDLSLASRDRMQSSAYSYCRSKGTGGMVERVPRLTAGGYCKEQEGFQF